MKSVHWRQNGITRFESMQIYGWSIEHSCDIPGVLNALCDAMKAHRSLWFNGILHCNVSIGDILICPVNPKNNDALATQGWLIDFDYAKRAPRFSEALFHDEDNDIFQYEVESLVSYWKTVHGIRIERGAAVELVKRYGPLNSAKRLCYIDHMRDIWPFTSTENQEMTFQRLRLKPWRSYPDWKERSTSNTERTGTKAFMSAEILSNTAYTLGSVSRTMGVLHSAIHDLESFFWVLLFLCLTRKGPGGERRDELRENPPADNLAAQKLHQMVHCLFDTTNDTVLDHNKRNLFGSPDQLEGYILESFHPYFDPLKPLVVEFWNVIRFGYLTYDDTAPGIIHELVLDLLETQKKVIDQSESVTRPDKSYKKMTEKEVDRRKSESDEVKKQLDHIRPMEIPNTRRNN